MDYNKIIDAETWAFIKKTEESYPVETATFGIDKQRDLYDAMCAVFRKDRPESVATEDITAAGVPCRIYTSNPEPRATVVYLHGGGFVVGGLESHDDVCAEICDRTGYRVVSADYRLAPEFTHPVPFEDSFAVTKWAVETYGAPVVLAGDSAGGNLSAAIAHAARAENIPLAGQVLIYPALGLDLNAGSYLTHSDAPMLSRSDIQFYHHVRFAGEPDETDTRAWPLRDEDFVAATGGLEHTLYGIADTNADLGLIAEYAVDSRLGDASTIFQNDIILGLRLALNDEADQTALLTGAVDAESAETVIRLEAERRLGEDFSVRLEGQGFINTDDNGLAASLEDDSFLRLKLTYCFGGL